MYTAEIQIGTPPQSASVLVDINYPTTIIFDSETNDYYKGNYVGIAGAPMYLNPFYVKSQSSTYLQFSYKSYVNNIVLCGFRFTGYLGTDNFCLNNSYKEFCYSTTFIDTYRVNNDYWFTIAQYPNIGGILGAGYFPEQ